MICDSSLKENLLLVHAEQRDELPLLMQPQSMKIIKEAQTGTRWSEADSQKRGCKEAVLQGKVPSEVQPST